MDLNVERARRWIGQLGVVRQARSHLVQRDTKGLCFCWIGTGALCAERDGYVRMVEGNLGPEFRGVSWGQHSPDVYGAVSHWLGVDDVTDIRCVVADLPAGLRGEVRQDLDADRRRRPGIRGIEQFERVTEVGHPLWLLNDCQVAPATLADVMRVAVGVDVDQVPA